MQIVSLIVTKQIDLVNPRAEVIIDYHEIS